MWSSNGPNVYDEDGEWVADCRVPSVYSQAQVEALAKQIAEDHNTVAQLRKRLGERLERERLARHHGDLGRDQNILRLQNHRFWYICELRKSQETKILG